MVTRTLKQRRAEVTRTALIRAAAEMFGQVGFERATVKGIAERAGLTLGAVYFHFRNKEHLAREIVVSQALFVVPPHPSEGLQHVVDLTLMWACRMLSDPLLQAGARLVMDQENFVAPEQNSHRQWADVLVEHLRAARARRELSPGVDVEELARVLVNACTGAQIHSRIETEYQDLPDRVEAIWRCLLPGIATPATAARIEYGAGRAGEVG
ncbi:ScbR family autoregulator-binding transcription factor [Streptomyces acidiscabies]|uniref:ScbR family autoregulator-binding transcription factor n=1 Tax=Streptomyces acidiscabies TaxID=42234 RepID=A0AAP6B9R3_9ACTN|nr:ScbR family autoregulator-binding transcription factor [Streptomyces acidiscabies]MBP5937174.1 TetR/AcrR family transcriptional regulator [Streptomyces sp. LBUM 1476]MBZ3914774.1 TetR/AcrR family transcriptional regulator [Streptomyces acidiscabies]MDX2960776.1 ScbR family autoregulator-binding transcription factor [Streptomyces acidiscabies]MDX3020688.1 ScbR family autoregulator-binding transcription factor [Streptomyces acidiscabies]MDX3792941.1 ScbR family autoregulator-binding transcrip